MEFLKSLIFLDFFCVSVCQDYLTFLIIQEIFVDSELYQTEKDLN